MYPFFGNINLVEVFYDYVVPYMEEMKNVLKNELLKKLSRKMVADPEDYMKSFRTNLQTYIDEKDISLADIAEAAGMSIETIKTLVYGKAADCKLSTAVNLARALNLSVDELVGTGTLSEKMRESIQITRNLPDNYVHFVRWAIRYHEMMLSGKKVTKKAVNIMYTECANNGNLIMNNNFELVDISDIQDDQRYKIFMGIRIPCEHYMPVLFEGDVLMLATDRNPLQNETVVVVNNGYISIVKRKEEKNEKGEHVARYYSIRNGQLLGDENSIEDVVGYVVKVCRASS